MKQLSLKKILVNMTFKEKCNYILYYYKVHIIICLLSIIFIGIFVYGQSTKKDVYINITYIGNYFSEDLSSDICDTLNSDLIPNDKSKTVVFDMLDTSNTQNLIKLQASFAASDIDFAIINEDFFNENYPNELFEDLNSIDGFSSLNFNPNSLLKKNEVVYGININYLNTFNKINYNNDTDNFLVLISNSKNTDKFIKLLSYYNIS